MSRRHIKVITFDLDNTLWDVEPALIRAEQVQNDWLLEHRPRVFEQFSAEKIRDIRLRVYQQNPALAHHVSDLRIESLYEVQLMCGYSQSMARDGAQSAFDAFLSIRHQVEPYEQATEILEKLATDYILGALTNGNADIFKLEIGDYFDFAFTAEQLGASKPLPDMFHASMRETGADSGQIVHVGDNPEHDILGAQNVGMYTVWMNSGGWRWPDGRAPADEEISSLDALPTAVSRIDRRAASQNAGLK